MVLQHVELRLLAEANLESLILWLASACLWLSQYCFIPVALIAGMHCISAEAALRTWRDRELQERYQPLGFFENFFLSALLVGLSYLVLYIETLRRSPQGPQVELHSILFLILALGLLILAFCHAVYCARFAQKLIRISLSDTESRERAFQEYGNSRRP